NLLVKHDQPVAPALLERVRALTNQSTAPTDAMASTQQLPRSARVKEEDEPATPESSHNDKKADDMLVRYPRRKATVFASRPVTTPLASELVDDCNIAPVVDHDTRRKLVTWLRQFPAEQGDFLSPINYFELKYSQARGLTSAWRDPQKDLVNELQIKDFMDYMAPDDIAHMLLRVLDDKTMISTFTPDEEHVLVTVAALMEHCQDIRNELSNCSLQDVIPIHSSVRNVLEKLLQYGDTSKEAMFSGGSQLQLNSQPNDNVDNNKPSPQDPERKGAISPVRAKAARVMPLADVCSAISSLLCEKLWQEANDRSKLTLRPFMRQYFIRVYGLKSLAMAHISSFKHSLAINQHENRRASLFYWFLGCDESRKFSADYAFEFFKSVVKHVLVVHNKAPVKPFLVQTTPDVMTSLESIQYAWTDLLGDGCVLDDVPDNNLNSSTKKRLVTLAKAIEVTKLSFYDGNDREATVSLFLDDLKDRVNPIGMEDFLSGIMDCWLKLFEFTVQLIRVKFKEADKNGDGTMDFEEFIAFMQASNVLGFSETKKRELARTEARMRREAIAIYDSLTNDDNIIDENAFIEYLLTQVQWLSNEEDATVVAAVVAPSPSDASPVSPVDHNPSTMVQET
ncbi:hypothetical protein DYB25_009618, partial [Aphanomyces astaci]